MPALNFKKQFAPMIESGEKRQTIRALRKDCRNPQTGQMLYLYTGTRTTSCRKLKEVICKDVSQLTIEKNGDIIVGIDCLDSWQEYKLACDDGFRTLGDFLDFFRNTYGLPFYGLLIMW